MNITFPYREIQIKTGYLFWKPCLQLFLISHVLWDLKYTIFFSNFNNLYCWLSIELYIGWVQSKTCHPRMRQRLLILWKCNDSHNSSDSNSRLQYNACMQRNSYKIPCKQNTFPYILLSHSLPENTIYICCDDFSDCYLFILKYG